MRAPSSVDAKQVGDAVRVIVIASWFFAAAFALVQAPMIGEGVLFYSIACVVIAGVLGTVGAVAWGSGLLKLKPVHAMIAVVFVSWCLALGATALMPRSAFGRLDAQLGITGQGFTPTIAVALLQPILLVVLLVGARFVRQLEGMGAHRRAEDEVARKVHAALVPDVDVKVGEIAVWGSSVPCDNTGGDFIEVFEDRGSVTVVVGDVSGHGVGAGILMAMIKGALRVRLQQETQLDRLMADLNELVLSLDRPGVFVTATAVRVHPDGRAECASAGHLPIMRFDPTMPKGADIPNECLPLGVQSEEVYVVKQTTLSQGETLALLTDGLVEVQDGGGKQIGMKLIRKVLASRLSAPLPEIFQTLAQRCVSFGRQTDDQTLVLIRFGQPMATLEPLPVDLGEELPVSREA
jgi:hypothetical protein